MTKFKIRNLGRALAASAAAAAVAAFAAPAGAAVFIGNWSVNPDGTITVAFSDTGIGTVNTASHAFINNNILDPNFGTSNGSASHTRTGTGLNTVFTDVYDFVLPTGFVTQSVISTHQTRALANLTFTSISFNGTAGVIGTIFTNAVAGVDTLPVVHGGPQHLVITGRGGAQASYAGTATFTPPVVPEPAVWSLLIMGFGGVGTMLRRRRDSAALA